MHQRSESSNRTLPGDVESNMRLVTRLLVLSTALLLALPPGWCCAAPAADDSAKESRSSVPPCCQGKHDESKPNNSTPSNTQHRNCQCCWAPESSTAPSKTILPDATLLALPVPVVLAPVAILGISEPIETGFASSSPPLHVLLCTWVC